MVFLYVACLVGCRQWAKEKATTFHTTKLWQPPVFHYLLTEWQSVFDTHQKGANAVVTNNIEGQSELILQYISGKKHNSMYKSCIGSIVIPVIRLFRNWSSFRPWRCVTLQVWSCMVCCTLDIDYSGILISISARPNKSLSSVAHQLLSQLLFAPSANKIDVSDQVAWFLIEHLFVPNHLFSTSLSNTLNYLCAS